MLNRFDGRHFQAVAPLLQRGAQTIQYTGWGTAQTVLQDSRGDWWVATGEGLCRYHGVRFDDLGRIPPSAVYTRDDGLTGNDIFRIFEDSHGDIWVGTVDSPGAFVNLTWPHFDHFIWPHPNPNTPTSAPSPVSEGGPERSPAPRFLRRA